MKSNIFVQIKRLLPTVISLYTFAIALLMFVVAINYKTDIDIGIFTRDPAAIVGSKGVGTLVGLEVNPFVGIVSNVGILCWCVCASICFFSSAILKNNINIVKSKYKTIARFFYYFGLISFIFLVDDLFLFHETIAPQFFHISEKIIYFCYVALILWSIIKYRKIIMATEWLLFLVAFLFLGCSVLMDGFLEYFASEEFLRSGLQILLEDSFKLLGIVSWFGYFTRVCFQIMNNQLKITSDRRISRKQTTPI